MGPKKYLFLILIIPIILFSGLPHRLQVSAMPTRNFTPTKNDQTSFYPLIVTKSINATNIQVNQSLIVQINIKNLNSGPMYGIQLTEPTFATPIFEYKGLPNRIMNLGTLNGQSNITFFYILTVFEPINNVTIPGTSITYYTSSPITNKTTLPLYTSYSPSVTFNVILASNNANIDVNNLLIVSGLFLVYSIIIIVRAITLKLNKQ